MKYPKGYEWLGNVGQLPRTISEGLALLGTIETPGTADNPVIIGWANEVGLSKTYSDDSIPWCGLFAAVVAKRAGKAVVGGPLWARNWAKFGEETGKPSLGDVLVFQRDGGGHVGFYVAEDSIAYHVLGGNQSDKVSIARVAKARCVATRRPGYTLAPASVRPYHVSASGSLSENEA
ncbi:TIGR02594 family protein [soil metagenome]